MSTFYQYASSRPNKHPFLDGERSLTYGELAEQTGKTAALLRDRGLQAGDRVLLATEDVAAFAPLLFALMDLGVAVVLSDPGMTPGELDRVCRLLDPAGAIVDDAVGRRLELPGRELRLYLPVKAEAKGGGLLGKLFGKKKKPAAAATTYPAVLDGLSPFEPPAPDPECVAYILMTSGSTSQPKAVPITHRSLATHLDTLVRQFGYDGDSRIMNLLPLHHADGVVQGAVQACRAGATWVRPFSFTVQNIEPTLHSIYSRRVTHFIGVPTILSLVLRMSTNLEDSFDTDDFRFIVSAAGKLETELWQSFERTFKTRVCNLFGLTETVTGSLFAGPGDDSHRHGTIGKPVDCDAKIVDAEGNEVAEGTTGELLLRGAHIFSGYISDDPSANDGLFADGWLRTGDLAHRDAEGYYVIDGRMKNVVITGGENIYPEEITEVLNEHPGVAATACFGVPHGDWGEVLVALVQRTDTELDENSLIAWARERLSAYKVPKEVAFVAELPYGPSGKVQMQQARALFDSVRASAGSDTGDVAERITTIAASTFKQSASALSPRSGPHNTPGWDSLAHITFVTALEGAFSVKIGTAEIMALQSLDDAINIVTTHLGSRA